MASLPGFMVDGIDKCLGNSLTDVPIWSDGSGYTVECVPDGLDCDWEVFPQPLWGLCIDENYSGHIAIRWLDRVLLDKGVVRIVVACMRGFPLDVVSNSSRQSVNNNNSSTRH